MENHGVRQRTDRLPAAEHAFRMSRVVVIAANLARELIVLQGESGQCGVFWVLAGPTIFVGDLMTGDVACRGRCRFGHPNGTCWARGAGEVLNRIEALTVLERSYLTVTGHRIRPVGWYPLINQGGKRIKSRLLALLSGRGVRVATPLPL